MSDKTSQVEKKLLDIKLVEIFPTRKNQLIDGEAKESPLNNDQVYHRQYLIDNDIFMNCF